MGKIVVSENVTLDGVVQDRPVRRASGAAAGSVVSVSGCGVPKLWSRVSAANRA
jgi:hypothetical protein